MISADFGDILRLNTEWVHFTSHLDTVALAAWLTRASSGRRKVN
jgi:hypothetical protein